MLTSPCTLTTSPCCLSLLFCQQLKEKSLLPFDFKVVGALYSALKYGNFLLETLDTFPLLKDAYTQSRKLYPSWYGALQQILNNIPKLKQLSTNQKVSKQTVKKILLEATRHQWALDRNKCSDGKLRTYVKF